MQTIEGYFDGKHIVPFAKLDAGKHYRVTITVLEELSPEEETRLLSAHSDAFDFWNDSEEDIYNDFVRSE